MGKKRTNRILELVTVMRGNLKAAEMAKKEMGAMHRKSVKMSTAMCCAILVSALLLGKSGFFYSQVDQHIANANNEEGAHIEEQDNYDKSLSQRSLYVHG